MLSHIIALGTFVIFVILGLASATMPSYTEWRDAHIGSKSTAENHTSGRTAENCLYNGWYLYKNKRYNEAINDFSEAIYLTPNHPLPFYLRGDAYYAINNYDAAISDYSQALRLYSNRPIPPYPYINFMNLGTGSTSGAFSYSLGDGSSMGNFSFSKILSSRGWAYNLKGDYDSAVADYTECIRIDPSISLYNNRGLIYHNKKDYDRAISDFTEAIKAATYRVNMNSNSNTHNELKRCYYNRGWSYHNKGDYDMAIEDYTQALRLVSNDAALFNRRGLSFEKKKTYYQAVSDFTQAVRLDPVNTEYGANLERVKQLQGNSR